jgi:hypothetical protein
MFILVICTKSRYSMSSPTIQCQHLFPTNLLLRRLPLQIYVFAFWNIRRAHLQTDAIKWTTYLITIWMFLIFIRPSTFHFCDLQIVVRQLCVICNGLR